MPKKKKSFGSSPEFVDFLGLIWVNKTTVYQTCHLHQQLQLKPHPSFGKIAPSGLKSKKKFNSPTCRCPWAGRLSVGCCDKESLSDMLRFPELYRCDSLHGLHGHFWHLQRKTATQFGITFYNSFSQVNHTPHLRQNHVFLLEIKNRKNAVWIKTINFFS